MDNIGILKINEQAQNIVGCIRFDKGSGKFDFPKSFNPFIDKFKKEIQGKYFHYPLTGGEPELKTRIVKFEQKSGRRINENQITVTHGGMSGLFAFFYLCLKPGDEILLNWACFEGFSLLANHFQVKIKRVNFSNIQSLEKAVTKNTKAIIFNSPENPTGKVYTKKEVQTLTDFAKEHNLYFVSDEVMNQVIYPKNEAAFPALKNSKVVIINSFSKNFFIPGIRLGWITTSSKELTSQFDNFISVQSLGVNLFSQILLSHILREIDYSEFITPYLKTLIARKNLVKKMLDKFQISYEMEPQGGMNFYVDLQSNPEKILPELLKNKVALIPGELFEGESSTRVRLGFGAVKEKEIEKGLNIIRSKL